MNIKKMTLAIIFLSLLTLGFTGCGSNSEDTDTPTSNLSADSTIPISPMNDNPIVTPISTIDDNITITSTDSSYNCENIQEYNGKTFTIKLSTTGKLQCNDLYGYPELEFTEGVNELKVSQLISTIVSDSNSSFCTSTTNLAKGTDHIVGNDPIYGAVDCVNTYDVTLPFTFYSANDIQNFTLTNYYQLINSTCPSWVNDNTLKYEEPSHSSLTEERVITETSGDISTISFYLNF